MDRKWSIGEKPRRGILPDASARLAKTLSLVIGAVYLRLVGDYHSAGLGSEPLNRGSKRRPFSHRGGKSPGTSSEKKTAAQHLTEINREVEVLKKELASRQASSVYGKRLDLLLHPLIVRGSLDNVELSRSISLCLCIPHELLAGVLQEAEASLEKETIGIMLGFAARDMITVTDGLPGESRSSTQAELSAEDLARLLDRGKLRNPAARFVGWYHSHVGHGVVPSKVDLKTQSVLQQFSPNIFALIVDPKSKELDAYVTEALVPVVSSQTSQDIVKYELPLIEQGRDGKGATDPSSAVEVLPSGLFEVSVAVPSVHRTVTLEVASNHTVGSLIEAVAMTLNLPRERKHALEHAGKVISQTDFGKSLGVLGIKEASKPTLRVVE